MSTKKKKSLFYYCFPCIKRSYEDPDELLFKNFGKEFTEYEYVIENLAIRRAPKILLDQYQPPPKIKQKQHFPKIKHTQTKKPIVKDFGAVVEKRGASCGVIGPVVKLDQHGDSKECCPRGTPKCIDRIKEDVLKRILIPPCHVFRVEHSTPRIQKVSAEVHKSSDGSMPRKQSIPSEIKQTIDALKVAKPPASSTLSRKNRRQLIRSVSDTSCDKETFCNFLDLETKKHENEREIRSSLLDVFSMQNKRKRLSKFQQERKLLPVSKLTEPNINQMGEQIGAKPQIQKNEKISQNTKTVTESSIESGNNQSLKWKIVINKHKGVTSSSEEK